MCSVKTGPTEIEIHLYIYTYIHTYVEWCASVVCVDR